MFRQRACLARRHSQLTTVLWLLPLLLVARKTLFLRIRDTSEFASIDRYAAVDITIVCFSVALTVYTLASSPAVRRLVFHLTSVKALVTYYSLCMVSALWSSHPAYSAYRGLEALSQILIIACAVCTAPSVKHAERSALLGGLTVLACELLGAGLLCGFAPRIDAWHTNTYTATAAVLLCYCAGKSSRADRTGSKATMYLIGSVSCLALALGASIGSNVAAAVGLCVVGLLVRPGALGLALLTGLWVKVLTYSNAISEVVFEHRSEQTIHNITGRTALWMDMFEGFKKSPWTGVGFAVGPHTLGHGGYSNSHNFIVSSAVGTGALGLLILLVYVWTQCRELWCNRAWARAGGAGTLACVLAAWTNSLTFPVLFDQWTCTAVVLCALVMARREGDGLLRRQRAASRLDGIVNARVYSRIASGRLTAAWARRA